MRSGWHFLAGLFATTGTTFSLIGCLGQRVTGIVLGDDALSWLDAYPQWTVLTDGLLWFDLPVYNLEAGVETEVNAN